MMTIGGTTGNARWPSRAEIAALDGNRRRAVAAALRTVERALRGLRDAGLAAASPDGVEALREAIAATGVPEPPVEATSLLAALHVTADELEPRRMERYGPLAPSENETLNRLAAALRDLLDRVAPPEAGTPAPILLRPIGTVHSPFHDHSGTPIQPGQGRRVEGTVVIAPPFVPALRDLEGFDRIWLVCWLDRAREWEPLVSPYRDDARHGLFATRAPSRPNPVGISAVRLLRIEGAVLHVAELDILDGTPVLDIKPYVPEFDAFPDSRAGWLETAGSRREADDRFRP